MKLTVGKRSGRQRLIIGLLTTLFLLSLFSQLGPQLSNLPNLPKIVVPSLPVGIRNDFNQIAKIVEPIFAGIPKLNWIVSSAQTWDTTGSTQCSSTSVGDTCGAAWSGRPTTVSAGGTVTAGDTLVLELNSYSSADAGSNACSGSEISDTESDSWTLAGTGQAGPDSQFDVDFYAIAASTSASFVVTISSSCLQYMGTTPTGAGGYLLFDITGAGTYSTTYFGNQECDFSGSTTTAKCYGGLGTGSVGGGSTENPSGDTIMATEEQTDQPQESCAALSWSPSSGPGCATWDYGSACSHSCSSDMYAFDNDWSGGASSFELECTYLGSGAHYCTQTYYAENVVVFNPPSVTLPLDCTSTNGSPTISLTGGSPSPSTASCSTSGTTTDISLNPSTTVTATVPANVSTTSYVFQISSAASLTATNAGCYSGTCSTWSLEIYQQLENTYQVSAPQGTFNTGLTWKVTDTSAGESSVNICTISSTVAGSDSCNGWGDYDQTATIPQAATGAASNTRWQSSAACTFTPTTGGNTENCNSYFQLSNTYQASTNGQGPPTWDSGLSAVVTGSLYGSTGQNICTISPSSGTTTTASCTGYADYDAAVSDPSTLSGAGSNIQWKVYGTSSWTDTTGGNTHTGTYYKQLQNTYQVTAEAQADFDTGMSWTVTGTVGGTGSSTVCTISSTAAATDSCTGYADYDLGVTIPQAASSPPANSRWQSSAACTSTLTSGGNTENCNSYKQLTNTYQETADAQSTFDTSMSWTATGSLYGSTGQTICTITSSAASTDSCTAYADYDQTVTIPQAASSPPANSRWQSSAACTFTQTTGANTNNCNSYKQLTNTYQASTNGQGPPDWDSGLSAVVTGSLYGVTGQSICTISPSSGTTNTAGCTGYADYDAAVSEPATMSGAGSNIQWAIFGTSSWTDTTGANTHTGTYYKQLQNTYAANANTPTTFSGSITFAITGTEGGVASSAVCTISLPASPSSGSYNCVGYADYDTTVNFHTFSTSNPSNVQWEDRGTTSFTDTTGGNTQTVQYYEEVQNTYAANANTPTTFSGSIAFVITGTFDGVSSSTICTISVPGSPSSGSYSCSGYTDYNTATSFPAFSTSNPSNVRWYASGTTSFTDTTGGNTHTVQYLEQIQNTFQETAHAQTDFDTSMSWTVTGTVQGVGGSTVCTISSTAAATDSCAGYSDYNLIVTIPQAASSPPANMRWQSSAACTFTPTTGGNTENCNSYKQLDNTYAANPSAPTTFSASITFAVTGSLYGVTGQSICPVTVPSSPSSGSYYCAGYADYDAAVSIASTASGSPVNQRWLVSGTDSWTDTTGSNTHTANYYLQDSTTVSYSIIDGAGSSSAPTLTYTYLGTAGTTYSMTTTPTVVWQDDGQGWTATNPLTGSGASERWDAASSTSGTSSAGQTIAPTYYHQFDVTVSITSIDGSIPGANDPNFSYTQFGSPATLTVAISQTAWADDSQAWGITNPISISSTDRFDSPSTTSGTITAATTFSITYYHQYKNGFSYTIVDSSTGSSPPTFKFFYEGSVNSTALSTSPASLWLDANPAVWNSTNPLMGSNSTVEWITGTPTGSTSSAGSTNIVYNQVFLVSTLLNPGALTIKFTNTTGSFTSTGTILQVSTNSTFTVVGSNFNGLYEMVTSGSTIYQVPKNFGNGIQVFSSVGLNLFNFTAGGGQQFLNMTGTSAAVIVLDPVPATGLSYTSTTVAGSPYTPTFSQSNTVIQVTTTGKQNILMYFVTGSTTQTQCVGPSCGGGGGTTATTSSTITVTATGVAGGGNTFVENGKVNVEPGSPSSQTISLVLDNTGSSSITQLTQLTFSNLSNVKVSFNPSDLPISVSSGATGSLPVQLQYGSLAPGTYVINGTATFTQYSSQANSYVTLHSGFTITLFVQALTGKGGSFNFAAFLTAYWWAFISAAILAVVGVGLFIRKIGR